ncbi:trichohyalin-like isoform X2 [Eriocheir sinensis]|uniref:trichohyalin-like isoform X2 n=1 Tax=Eriocheir sinensis TaxID=95602 RepID=UPI0021C936E1|nr:trichohyalin-like isoform X2 [Eriocheir sinensis]
MFLRGYLVLVALAASIAAAWTAGRTTERPDETDITVQPKTGGEVSAAGGGDTHEPDDYTGGHESWVMEEPGGIQGARPKGKEWTERVTKVAWTPRREERDWNGPGKRRRTIRIYTRRGKNVSRKGKCRNSGRGRGRSGKWRKKRERYEVSGRRGRNGKWREKKERFEVKGRREGNGKWRVKKERFEVKGRKEGNGKWREKKERFGVKGRKEGNVKCREKKERFKVRGRREGNSKWRKRKERFEVNRRREGNDKIRKKREKYEVNKGGGYGKWRKSREKLEVNRRRGRNGKSRNKREKYEIKKNWKKGGRKGKTVRKYSNRESRNRRGARNGDSGRRGKRKETPGKSNPMKGSWAKVMERVEEKTKRSVKKENQNPRNVGFKGTRKNIRTNVRNKKLRRRIKWTGKSRNKRRSGTVSKTVVMRKDKTENIGRKKGNKRTRRCKRVRKGDGISRKEKRKMEAGRKEEDKGDNKEKDEVVIITETLRRNTKTEGGPKVEKIWTMNMTERTRRAQNINTPHNKTTAKNEPINERAEDGTRVGTQETGMRKVFKEEAIKERENGGKLEEEREGGRNTVNGISEEPINRGRTINQSRGNEFIRDGKRGGEKGRGKVSGREMDEKEGKGRVSKTGRERLNRGREMGGKTRNAVGVYEERKGGEGEELTGYTGRLGMGGEEKGEEKGEKRARQMEGEKGSDIKGTVRRRLGKRSEEKRRIENEGKIDKKEKALKLKEKENNTKKHIREREKPKRTKTALKPMDRNVTKKGKYKDRSENKRGRKQVKKRLVKSSKSEKVQGKEKTEKKKDESGVKTGIKKAEDEDEKDAITQEVNGRGREENTNGRLKQKRGDEDPSDEEVKRALEVMERKRKHEENEKGRQRKEKEGNNRPFQDNNVYRNNFELGNGRNRKREEFADKDMDERRNGNKEIENKNVTTPSFFGVTKRKKGREKGGNNATRTQRNGRSENMKQRRTEEEKTDDKPSEEKILTAMKEALEKKLERRKRRREELQMGKRNETEEEKRRKNEEKQLRKDKRIVRRVRETEEKNMEALRKKEEDRELKNALLSILGEVEDKDGGRKEDGKSDEVGERSKEVKSEEIEKNTSRRLEDRRFGESREASRARPGNATQKSQKKESVAKDLFLMLKEAEMAERGAEGEGVSKPQELRNAQTNESNLTSKSWEEVKQEMERRERERKNETLPRKGTDGKGMEEEQGKLRESGEFQKEPGTQNKIFSGKGTKSNTKGMKLEHGELEESEEFKQKLGTQNKNLTGKEADDRGMEREHAKPREPEGESKNTPESKKEKDEKIHHPFPSGRVFTNNNTSPVYLQPTWESSLSLLGVKAASHVTAKYFSDSEPTSITLHIKRPLQPTKGVNETPVAGKEADAGETLLQVNGKGVNTDIVTNENVRLNPDAWNWFTVFQKDKVFAVFRAGDQIPVLVYAAPPYSNISCTNLTLVQVWSRTAAEWDLRGDFYNGENEAREPKDPAIRKELTGLRGGLLTRLGVAALLKLYGWSVEDDDPRLIDYGDLRESMMTVRPLKIVLVYFGRAGSVNESWHDEEKVKQFHKHRNISTIVS